MRKVILQEFVTVNGLAAGPNGTTDYISASLRGDATFGHMQSALMDATDTMLLGRVTYQMFSSYWPNVTEGDQKPFADKLNSKKKLVFSRTLERAPWGSSDEGTIIRGSPADEVAKLKRQPGQDMVLWGSLTLAQSLIEAGLIDEYRLVVCPVVLGGGRALFEDGPDSLQLKLLEARTLERGAVSLTYVHRE